MKKIWTFIKGYENKYQISNYGDVRRWVVYKEQWNVLKPCKHSNGYLYFGLYSNKKCRRIFAHRLVALHFIPQRKNKNIIHHINGKRNDNRVNNLMWSDYSYNIKDGFKKGRVSWNKGNYIMHDKTCPNCNKKFKHHRKRAIFCSRSCAITFRHNVPF